MNALTYDANVDIGAAGAQFPRLQRFYIAVDSRADPFTNRPLKGKYLLNSWVNDVTPPSVRLLTTRVSAGRPLIVAQAVDAGSGVDPLSLVVQLRQRAVGASAYDPLTGLVVFGMPTAGAEAERRARRPSIVAASDYQEAKNINTVGNDIYPNTAFLQSKLTVVDGPDRDVDRAAGARVRAEAATAWSSSPASTTRRSRTSSSATASHRIGVDKSGPGGVYSVAWNTNAPQEGHQHLLSATVDGRVGPHAPRPAALIRVCK